MEKHYISFPGLGIEKMNVSREVFTIGNFPIYWYGLLIGIGLALALLYAFKRAKYFKLDVDRMIDVVMVSTLFAMAGARLYFILFDADLRASFKENPLIFFDFRKGGLAIYGGVIFAFLTAIWMCKVRKVDILSLFDIAGLGFLIGQGIGRWGNFFNQEAFGRNTTLPWGMTGSIIQTGETGSGYELDKLVHPTFFYEFLWCLLGFILLHIISKKAYKFRGQIFTMYLMWYGVGRFMIEGLRTDSLMLGQIRVSQLIAVLSVIGGFVLFMVFKSRHDRSPIDLFAEPVPADGVLEEGEKLDGDVEETDELKEASNEDDILNDSDEAVSGADSDVADETLSEEALGEEASQETALEESNDGSLAENSGEISLDEETSTEEE